MKRNTALIQLNLGLIFMSTSGVLGRYISVDSTITTVSRALIAAGLIFVFCKVLKVPLSFINKKSFLLTGLSAILLGAHWVTYFYALDLSNVAIALLSLYTYAAITPILEPLLTKEPFQKRDIYLSFLAVIGVAIMLPEINFSNNYTKAILLGLLSALLYALRNITISIPASNHDGSALMFHQLWMIGLLMTPFYGWLPTDGLSEQWVWIVLLALITTAMGHTLFVKSMRTLTASTAGLLSCIVPVYGILWAYFLLDEHPSSKTLVGGSLIIAVVLIKAVNESKLSKARQSG